MVYQQRNPSVYKLDRTCAARSTPEAGGSAACRSVLTWGSLLRSDQARQCEALGCAALSSMQGLVTEGGRRRGYLMSGEASWGRSSGHAR